MASLFSGNRVLAQSNIVADDTLGAENSVVIQNFNGTPTEVIVGGAERGQNLFHSFEEFNVETNRNAFFFSPDTEIQNILARVTGGNPSEILGALGTFGNSEPNLFLINPRGIVFGPNARLEVGGSFVASTADLLVFENGFEFGATNPEAPPLLTINVPVGLQYGANPGGINNQSRFGLRVQPERTLALVGGEVDLEGGVLSAPNGRIELASVAGNSLVNLLPTDAGYSLDYEGVRGFQDIRLSQAAEVESSGGDSSSIWVQGRNIFLTGGSQIFTFTRGAEAGGNLNVSASESVELIGGGGLFAITVGTGNGGDLTLTARQLLVQDGAQVSASTFSEGDGGTLTVEVEELVQLSGTSANGGFSSGVFAATTGKGDGGNLSLTAGQLLVRDGAVVSANTFSGGNGGTLTIEVSELVQVKGIASNGRFPSSIGAETRGTGNGGNLTLTTRQLLVQDGATVSASTVGEGNGGTLTVKVSDSVQLTGTTPNGRFGSGIGVETRGMGNGGNLALTTRQLLVQDGATVSASTFGEGNGGSLTVEVSELVQLAGTTPDSQFASGVFAQTTGKGDGGNLTLIAGQLLVQDGAAISASTVGEGNGGTLTVEVSELVRVIGIAPNGQFVSSIAAETQGVGNGGDVRLTAGQLLVRDGATISASTVGEGNGGTLTIEVSELVQLIGSTPNGQFGSAIAAGTFGQGEGGNLTLKARQLLVQNGATVSTSTFGEGNGGTLMLDVSESIFLDRGGGIGSVSFASGNGGDLILTTDQLTVRDGSVISVSSTNSRAGNLTITADTLTLNNGEITAETGVTGAEEGANIILQDLEFLLLENESLISATALEDANGGNVTIDADFIVAKPPEGPEGSDITANAVRGNGGRVSVTSNGLFGIEFRPQLTPLNDITVSSQFGLAGDFIDNTPGIDPNRGLATLPGEPRNPQPLEGCQVGGRELGSRFINIGRGGLPANPTEPLGSSEVWEDVQPPQTQDAPLKRIVEADRWTVNDRGEVVLVARSSAPNLSLCDLR